MAARPDASPKARTLSASAVLTSKSSVSSFCFPVRRIRIVNSEVPAGDTQRVFAAVSIGIGPIVLADTKDEVSDGDRDGGGNERAATAPAATLGVLVGRGVSLAASAPPAAASD